MDDLIQEFLTETTESLNALDSDIVKLEQNHNDKDLIGGLALKLCQLFVKALGRPGRNDTSVIVEITVRFRRNCFGGLRDESAGEKRENSKAESCSRFRHPEQNRKSGPDRGIQLRQL